MQLEKGARPSRSHPSAGRRRVSGVHSANIQIHSPVRGNFRRDAEKSERDAARSPDNYIVPAKERFAAKLCYFPAPLLL